MNILDEIVAQRKKDIAEKSVSLGFQIPETRTRGITPFIPKGKKGVILEIKRASPSKGSIAPNLNAGETAKAYANAKTSAISVLTEEHWFKGNLEDLQNACRAVDEYEGSPSGNLIRFLNKLAQRFPDKEFSTLAYLYSMHPPKHTRPLPNVNIMLCDIDCKREVPLTDNASGQDFMKALTGWSAISDNIFVWDYGINFDNQVAPFPNFHILQKNIQLFKENHATMLFEQVNGLRGTDFSELRAYMLSKLMWNPSCDADSLMQTFLKGYYGPSAPYLYQYQKLLQNEYW